MKKSFLLLSVLVTAAFVAAHCGGDDNGGGSAQDPDASDFENPTASVTDENATEFMNGALEASQTNSAGNVIGGFTKLSPAGIRGLSALPGRTASIYGQDSSACESLDGTELASCYEGCDSEGAPCTIDFGCWGEAGYNDCTDCTLDGTLTYSTEGNIFLYEYDNLTFDCADGTFTCDGEARYDTSGETDFYCSNVTCTINGESYSDNACYLDGSILVDGAVCLSISPNADCSSVCADWEDAEGTLKIDCEVTDRSDSCPSDVTGIRAIGTCTITRDASCDTL